MSQPGAVRATRPAAVRPAARLAQRPVGRAATSRLRVVASPVPARSRAGLVVGCLSLLGTGLVALLLLNVNLEKGAFVRRQQQARLEQLLEQRQALQEQLEALEAPQSLAARAAELGMVQAPNAAFIRTSDGRIIGVPTPGVAPISPTATATSGTSAGQRTGAVPSKISSKVEKTKQVTISAGTSSGAPTRRVAKTSAVAAGTG
jgi:cell division protein FtsB